MAEPKTRPLSPHLTIWRWGPGMAASIFHRVSGAGLSIVGLAVLTWWLVALSGGPEPYALFTKAASNIFGRIVLIGLTWAFFQHFLSGVRHLVMDTGAGFELRTNNRFAMLVFVGAVVLTAALWAYALGVVK
ncbi:MAG TPA: succinate dehydrogenase, cytochrome b556 subunit [Sphingomicrobium sp.]|nr:succinate dehydrogenase, cytochrome b556 subunit [Sphingomicrobium sp.]